MSTASLSDRVLPPFAGVRRWRHVVFSLTAALAGLFATVGIGAAYYTTSWFMTDPTDIESRVHGVSVGGGMLFLGGLTLLVASRRAHLHPAAVWAAAAGLTVKHVLVLSSLNDSLPEEAMTNAIINATSVPVPALLALLLYPRLRQLLEREPGGGSLRLVVALAGIAAAVAGAVPLLAAQASALASVPFVDSQPRYAETAGGLVMVAVGLVIVALAIRGWQTVAMLTGVVATSVGVAGLAFATDNGAPGTIVSAALLATGMAQMALAWQTRRAPTADA